jgi:hypothetical protein
MRHPSRMSDDPHPGDPPLPTVRDSAGALGTWLARIDAPATILRRLTSDLRDGSSREARDIVLASRQPLIVRQKHDG